MRERVVVVALSVCHALILEITVDLGMNKCVQFCWYIIESAGNGYIAL